MRRQSRDRRAARAVYNPEDDARAWTRIRTPSPEMTYMPWGHACQGYPPPFVQSPVDNTFTSAVAISGLLPQRHLGSVLTQGRAADSNNVPVEAHSPGSPSRLEDSNDVEILGSSMVSKQGVQVEDNGTPRLGLAGGEVGFVEDLLEDFVSTPRLGPMAGVDVHLVAPSRGSVGHPHNCAPACKYAKKKRGCKDGAACSHCHLCIWHSHRPRFPRTGSSTSEGLSAPAAAYRPKKRGDPSRAIPGQTDKVGW